MCDVPPIADQPVSRRRFLVAAPIGVAGVAVLASSRPAVAASVAQGLDIVPRSEWGPTLTPKGPVPDEADVRFLLVHHTVNANTYAASAVPGILTGIFNFHTGDKGWPDIAYNFFIDRFGGVWEGRLGSLQKAKAVDATGGSQGFAQLCCFIGDHSTDPPTAAAQASMGRMLGWLAQRHGVSLADGARVQFTSRGSNKLPAGTQADVATVSGHRDVSQTACPGDAAYALVADGTFRRLARGGGPSGPAPTTAPAPTTTTTKAKGGGSTTTAPKATSSTTSSSTSSSSTTSSSSSTTSTTASDQVAAPGRTSSDDSGNGALSTALTGAGVLAVVAAGLVAVRARRQP